MPERPLLVEQATMFIEIFCWMMFVQLDGDGHRWGRRRSMYILLGSDLGFCDCRSSFHVVGKVLVEIIRIVVVEVETLCGIALGFFRDANHEDFMSEVLNFLILFA